MNTTTIDSAVVSIDTRITMQAVSHNTENPVGFDQAKKELGVSSWYLSALKKQLGIRSRMFMLSPIRDFLRDNPSFTTTTIFKPRHKSLRIEHDGKRWVVTMTSHPDVMAADKSLTKALAQVGPMVEQQMAAPNADSSDGAHKDSR